MRANNVTLLRLQPLFTGHEDGHWALPPTLIEKREAVDRIDGYRAPASDLAYEKADLIAAFAAAAHKGHKWPSAAPVVKTAAAIAEAREKAEAATQAGEQLALELLGALDNTADALSVDCLRPVRDTAVADGREAVAELAAAGVDPLEALWAADVLIAEKLRPARHRLNQAREKYAAVGEVHGRIIEFLTPPEVDTARWFRWCTNYTTLYPGFARRDGGARPPWPTDDPVGGFVWRIEHADLWLPTSSEMDERHRVVFAENMAAQIRGQQPTLGVYAG